MPNLVWVPSPLSALSDMHESQVQKLLQATSVRLFRDATTATSLRPYADYAWSRLPAPATTARALDPDRLALFEVGIEFVNRRIGYLDSFVSGADEILNTGGLTRKLISSRYTAGLPQLGKGDIKKFRESMASYRDALRNAT
jgi:hypothetical protein